MTDNVFELLMKNPTVTIISVTVLLVLFMLLFKEQIKKYLIKRYKLYTEEQMIEFARKFQPKLDKRFIQNELKSYRK